MSLKKAKTQSTKTYNTICAFLNHIKGGEPQLIEGDIFKIIIPLVPPEKGWEKTTPEVTPEVIPKSERLLPILKYCIVPRSRKEIQELIKIKDSEYFRKSILQPLIREKLLRYTIPDKPNSPKQKYVITGKGRELLEAMDKEGF